MNSQQSNFWVETQLQQSHNSRIHTIIPRPSPKFTNFPFSCSSESRVFSRYHYSKAWIAYYYYSYSVVTMTLDCIYNCQDKVRYWSKIAIFSHPLFDVTVRVPVGNQNIAKNLCTEKLEWCGYPMVNSLIR